MHYGRNNGQTDRPKLQLMINSNIQKKRNSELNTISLAALLSEIAYLNQFTCFTFLCCSVSKIKIMNCLWAMQGLFGPYHPFPDSIKNCYPFFFFIFIFFLNLYETIFGAIFSIMNKAKNIHRSAIRLVLEPNSNQFKSDHLGKS